MLYHKKKMLRDEVIPDLNKLIDKRIIDLSGTLVPHLPQISPLERTSSIHSMMKPSTKLSNQDTGRRRIHLNSLVSPPSSEQSDIHIDIIGADKVETKT